MKKSFIWFLIPISVIFLFYSPIPALAADNIFTNFTIRDVFAAQTILVTDGIRDFAILTTDTCVFTQDDIRQQITIPASVQANPRDQSSFQFNDEIQFGGQVCTVSMDVESDYIFYPFTITKVEQGDVYQEVTGKTPDGNKYLLNLSMAYYDENDLQAGDVIYFNGNNYEPGNSDWVYLFYEYSDQNYWYDINVISSSTLLSGPGYREVSHKPRIGFWAAHGSSVEDFQPNQEALTFVNRTREIISTRKWRLLNSEGTYLNLPTVQLRINQRLKIKMGKGEDGRVSPVLKKVFLNLSESFIHPGVEWVTVLNQDNQVVMTYYLR